MEGVEREGEGENARHQKKNTIRSLLQYIVNHEKQDSYNYIIFSL